MREPRSYIVRIYRRGYQSLSGVVEDTHTSGQRAFHSIQELSALLRTPIASNRPSGRRAKFRSTK
jgi:hypothetical protein